MLILIAAAMCVVSAGAVDPNSADVWSDPSALNVSDMAHGGYGREESLIGIRDGIEPIRDFNLMHERMDLPPDEYRRIYDIAESGGAGHLHGIPPDEYRMMHEDSGDYEGVEYDKNMDGRIEGSSVISAGDEPVSNTPASASAYIPTATDEFSGEVVQLTGAQTTDIVWDKDNFGGFCYDINGGVGTETLTILPYTLEGPDTDRIIDDTWTCNIPPTWQEYELYKSLGLTVDGKSGYWTNILENEKYVATNGTSNKYTKLLMELNSTDKKTLATGDSWSMGGGFVLEAAQIDLEGDRVWLQLWKDGTVVASKVITIDPNNRQSRVYIYTKEIAGELDVPVFSCYVDAVFRGTNTNIVQIKYVFLIENEIVDYSLVYTTHPIWQEYELHKNLGLTVERIQYVGYSGYYRTEFWMGTRYVAIGGNASKLAEPLVEFNSTDTKTLTTGEPWNLGGGFVLTAQQIDLEGNNPSSSL